MGIEKSESFFLFPRAYLLFKNKILSLQRTFRKEIRNDINRRTDGGIWREALV